MISVLPLGALFMERRARRGASLGEPHAHVECWRRCGRCLSTSASAPFGRAGGRQEDAALWCAVCRAANELNELNGPEITNRRTPPKYRLGLRAVTATSRKIISSSGRRGARSLGGWGLGEVGASMPALISYLLSASLWVISLGRYASIY